MTCSAHAARASALKLTCAALWLAVASPAEARVNARRRLSANQPMPMFRLERLDGRVVVSREQLRGDVTVLVVGRTLKAAPPCRAWGVRLIKRYGTAVQVYQVVVADKPWYIPRAIVRYRVRGFTPRAHRKRVLLEWKTGFADLIGMPRHDDPVLLVIDRGLVLCLRHRGKLSPGALAKVHRAVTAARAKK